MTVPGQLSLPPRKIVSRLGLGFGSKPRLVLGLGGNQTIVPERNCLQVRVRVWLRVSFGVAFRFTIFSKPIAEQTKISIDQALSPLFFKH